MTEAVTLAGKFKKANGPSRVHFSTPARRFLAKPALNFSVQDAPMLASTPSGKWLILKLTARFPPKG